MSAMAIERDQPENKVQPAKAEPDPRDSELEKLRGEVAASKARYDADMQQVAEALKNPETVKALAAQFGSPANAETTDDQDDSALVDRKALKRMAEDVKRSVAGAIVETTAASSRQMRSAQKELLRGKLTNFDRYEHEVDTLLDKMDPRVASDPSVIKQVHEVVRAKHMDEEFEERLAAKKTEWEAELRAKGYEPEEIEAEIEERAEAAEAAAPASRPEKREAAPTARRAGVAPGGDASPSRPTLRRRESVEPLSREERQVASVFGIDSAEEFRKYADPTWRPDSFGFRGKQRI